MRVIITWTELRNELDPLWGEEFCLYAYLHPKRDWLLYVGKADYSTIRQRLHGYHKSVLFRDLSRQYAVDAVRVLHGGLVLETGRRLSSELLADTESLLIKRLQPFGNIQSTRSRISRPGLLIECHGDWPLKRRRFEDK